MLNLDEAIRAKLADYGEDPCGYATCIVVGFSEMRAAITAVLDRHALHPDGGIGYEPDDGSKYERMSRVCASCGPPDEYAVQWPCPEVRAIAAAFGIEVDDA